MIPLPYIKSQQYHQSRLLFTNYSYNCLTCSSNLQAKHVKGRVIYFHYSSTPIRV